MEFPIEPPIEVNKGVDPDKIGKHYSNLHEVTHSKNYEDQGFSAKTGYRVEKKGKKDLIKLFVDLTKLP